MIYYDMEIIVTQYDVNDRPHTSHSIVRGLSLEKLASLLYLNEVPSPEHYKITMNIRGVNY